MTIRRIKFYFKETAMFNRILGVLKLDSNTFEEIEHDENATT